METSSESMTAETGPGSAAPEAAPHQVATEAQMPDAGAPGGAPESEPEGTWRPGSEEEAGAEPEGEPVESAALARDLLDQVLQAMGVPATVEAQRQPDGTVRLLVEGPEMGVVIGKHGATINALQYLTGLMVQKRTGERLRLVIDAEGYRNRREQALRDMARAYAQRVKETGNEAVLDALQSYERRIIHTCLADDPEVFTYSEGEEPDRRVVISPREAEGEG